jgi:Domain of unknown function (DUF4160)
MPEISRFLGIVIQMYYSDHARPHFHARCGGYRIKVDIESGVVSGEFPPRPLRAVLDWTVAHTDELRDNWNRARNGHPLVDIAPLE